MCVPCACGVRNRMVPGPAAARRWGRAPRRCASGDGVGDPLRSWGGVRCHVRPAPATPRPPPAPPPRRIRCRTGPFDAIAKITQTPRKNRTTCVSAMRAIPIRDRSLSCVVLRCDVVVDILLRFTSRFSVFALRSPSASASRATSTTTVNAQAHKPRHTHDTISSHKATNDHKHTHTAVPDPEETEPTHSRTHEHTQGSQDRTRCVGSNTSNMAHALEAPLPAPGDG